jgi:hypothetical protein
MQIKSVGHQNANSSGNILERVVMALQSWGFRACGYTVWDDAGRSGDKLILTRVPLVTPYGTQGHTEFGLVLVAGVITYRIESKWQAVAGSVDEKFPYLVEAMLLCPEPRIILLYGGTHLEQSPRGQAAINFVRTRFKAAQLDGRKDFAAVFTQSEFTSWAQSEFRPRQITPVQHEDR